MNKIFITLMLSSLGSLSLSAATAAPAEEIQYATKDPVELKELHDTVKASQNFVQLLDTENFGKSWNDASAFFKATISEEEWTKTMNTSRKPLGKLIRREIGDQRTSKNPENLPKGDYMVLFYRSKFANKEQVYELVTLFKEDGVWKVLTYQVN